MRPTAGASLSGLSRIRGFFELYGGLLELPIAPFYPYVLTNGALELLRGLGQLSTFQPGRGGGEPRITVLTTRSELAPRRGRKVPCEP